MSEGQRNEMGRHRLARSGRLTGRAGEQDTETSVRPHRPLGSGEATRGQGSDAQDTKGLGLRPGRLKARAGGHGGHGGRDMDY